MLPGMRHMTDRPIIVTSSYRPKRAPPKRKPRTYPENVPTIVEAKPPKKRLNGPVIRLNGEVASDDPTSPMRSAIVEPKRKPNSMLAHLLDEITDEERNRRADLAEEMFREIRRRAAEHRD